eukprot:TRINITY_DN5802_c0_g1_i1.p1 TRINITY_DN5802_c0_g1~~TRINITY_DN5802_c0_g1_i1.p1  ORF type:complete len:371 (+),score=158.02 TRINITY_DN5802_c0_g1_i1:226-1338(+)
MSCLVDLKEYIPEPFEEWKEIKKINFKIEGKWKERRLEMSSPLYEELWVILRVTAVLLSEREHLPLDSLELEFKVRSCFPISHFLCVLPSFPSSQFMESDTFSVRSTASSFLAPSLLRRRKREEENGNLIQNPSESFSSIAINEWEEKKEIDWDRFCYERGWSNLDHILIQMKEMGLISLMDHALNYPFQSKSSANKNNENNNNDGSNIRQSSPSVQKSRASSLIASNRMVVVMNIDQIRTIQFFSRVCKDLGFNTKTYLGLDQEDLLAKQELPNFVANSPSSYSPSRLQTLFHSSMKSEWNEQEKLEEERTKRYKLEDEKEMNHEEIDALIKTPTFKESEFDKFRTEILNVLEKPSVKERMIRSREDQK